ncbi:MAG: peptide deformylase, partial [Bacilli bacterium]|nr:peptide deformylase [Bacilli bacterium]
MLLMKDILDESDKRLREISKEVEFPLSKDEKNTIKEMVEFLRNSQIPDIAEKYDLRPGMGLA